MMDEVSVTDCSVNPVDLACMQIGQKLQRIFQWKQFAVMFTLRGRDKVFDKCTVFFYCIETQKLLIEILSNRKSCQIIWDARTRSRRTTADERLSVGESKKHFAFYSEVLMCCFLSGVKRPCLTKEFGANGTNLQTHWWEGANLSIAALM